MINLLSALCLTTLVLISAISSAESKLTWRFFPKNAPAQKELLKMIKKGSYTQALLFWHTSLDGEAFVETTNGKALFNYLLWKTGAPVLAAERLFALRTPQHIHQTLVELWKMELSTGHESVYKARVNIGARWRKVLGASLSRQLQRPPIYALNSVRSLKAIQKDLKSKTLSALEQDQLTFQLGLAAAIQDKNQLAYNQFVRLLESDQAHVSKDDLLMALARLSYQEGEYDAAIDWYKQVPKSSPQWLESKEERAWAHVRLDQPNLAVAQLETATSPVFTALSSPESDFLDSFVSLMICDYSRIFKITGQFKRKHAEKIRGLETLAKSRNTPLHRAFVKTIDKNSIRLSSFSKLVRSLPRDFILDEFLRRHMEYRRSMAKEGQLLKKLNAGNVQLAIFSSDAPEDSLEAIFSQSQIKARQAYKDISDRLAALAGDELEEYKLMIRKLHIVEAEVIQRLHLDENIKGTRAKRENPVPRGSETLSFPVTKEVWLDELDSYHAEVKDCPKIERAAL